MLSNITITNLHYRSLQVCFEAARQSLSSSQILWQQQLGFSRPAAGWIHPAARDYISAAPTSPVASHFLLRPIRGDLRPTRGDLSNERGFHQIVGTRESWSSRRQQTKQHFFLLPIQIVWGDSDAVAPMSIPQTLSKLINPQYLSFTTLPGAGKQLFVSLPVCTNCKYVKNNSF